MTPVERTSAQIPADAPALACAALAALFAMRQAHRFSIWENPVLSALFAIFSIFAKQNMIPLLVGLAIWFVLRAGWKVISSFTASIGLFSALLICPTVSLLGGFEPF
jgi:hypothetical protein